MTKNRSVDYKAVILAPLLAFAFSMLLAIAAGIFLALFGGFFLGEADESSPVFDFIFVGLFVMPAYVVCGFIAAKLASSRFLLHALIAGTLLLIANVALTMFGDAEDPVSLLDAICFASIVPLSVLGSRLAQLGQ
jgi:hypothetical protein